MLLSLKYFEFYLKQDLFIITTFLLSNKLYFENIQSLIIPITALHPSPSHKPGRTACTGCGYRRDYWQ